MLTKEEIREIIEEEIEVDCYHEMEVHLGWAAYLGDQINYPFKAKWPVKSAKGGSRDERVTVVRNISNDGEYNGGPYLVEVEYKGDLLQARLSDLTPIDADEETAEAMEVWKRREE